MDKAKHPLWRLGAPVLLGALLSTSIELAQLYVPGRNSSLLDIIANIAGAVIGIPAAILIGGLGSKRRDRDPDRGAIVVFVLFGLWELFPFFPALSRTELAGKLTVAMDAPFLPVAFASAAMCWLLAGRLLVAVDASPATFWLGGLLLVIPAQFLIARQPPDLSDVLGAAAGFCCFAIWGQRAQASRVVACGFVLLLLFRGLAPFHFEAGATRFLWVPFGALLESQWGDGVPVLLEKLFFYGAAIWALRSAGVKLSTATLIVAAELGAIELLQMYLPGRTPEITDPLIALLLGAAAMSDRLGLSAVQIDERAL